MNDGDQVLAVLRECRVCGVVKPLSKFLPRNRTCAVCLHVHTRSWVVTEYGREAIREKPPAA